MMIASLSMAHYIIRRLGLPYGSIIRELTRLMSASSSAIRALYIPAVEGR